MFYKKTISYLILPAAIFSFAFGLFFSGHPVAQAGILDKPLTDKMMNQETSFTKKAGFELNQSADSIIALVIKAFLGLLGIIFVILIVIAGNKWMTAGGEEEKVNEAKETIQRAIIGLVIVVSAYAITFFVFSNLPGGGGVQGPG